MPDFDLDSALSGATFRAPSCPVCGEDMTVLMVYWYGGEEWIRFHCQKEACEEDESEQSVTLRAKIVRVVLNDQEELDLVRRTCARTQCPVCRNVETENRGNRVQPDGVRSSWDCAECGSRWIIVREVRDA